MIDVYTILNPHSDLMRQLLFLPLLINKETKAQKGCVTSPGQKDGLEFKPVLFSKLPLSFLWAVSPFPKLLLAFALHTVSLPQHSHKEHLCLLFSPHLRGEGFLQSHLPMMPSTTYY